MKITATLLLLLSSICLFAQEDEFEYKIYDFSKVDAAEVDTERLSWQMDSIYFTSGFDSLAQLMSFAKARQYKRGYVSFNIGWQLDNGSLDDMNNALTTLGLPAMSEEFQSVPWGGDFCVRRLLISYLLVSGIKNKSENSDYRIDVSGLNLQLMFGYDILNLRRLHLYPQIAFCDQDFDINVTRKNASVDIVNSNQLLQNLGGTTLERSSFDMSLGGALDYHLIYSPSKTGIIIGLRYGKMVPLSQGDFKLGKMKSAFQTNDNVTSSFISVLVKLYVKTDF